MSTRETAVSKTIEYQTATCTNCNEELFVDSEKDNIDGLPEGIPVILTGGENMTVDTTDLTTAAKNYRIPKTIVKIFGFGSTDSVEQSYICRSCAKSVYRFDPGR